MDLLADTTSWSLLLGFVLPWLVAVVNRPWWPTWARRWVAIVAAVIGGLLVSLANGAFGDGVEPIDIAGACLTVLIASQVVYGHLFPESVRMVERATSRRKARTGRTDEPERPDDPPRHTFEGYPDEPGEHSQERRT